jgi:hypothetical protein
MSNNKNTARKTFANLVAPQLATAIAPDSKVTLTIADLQALLDQAKAGTAPAAEPAKRGRRPSAANVPAPVAASVVKPEHIAPVTDADFVMQGKIAECFKAARAHAAKVAPWNGIKGAGSVGGQYSAEGRAAFKAGYNAKAKELGVPARY